MMNAITQQLSNIAKQKGLLLKEEADLWNKLSILLLDKTLKDKISNNDKTAKARCIHTIYHKPETAIIRMSDVTRRTGLSKASIYRKMKEKSFPPSFSLGLKAIGWLERDIEQWILEKYIVNF